ncbi:MAG: molybdopterin-dependent oxidoreductase [Pseudomonadales bacterium]|jgi:isoquinoline 1-oxidoreductase beta subunit|nr:molybdopterin-dependent oxidoreductase [Pseudomonadales bacterium]
MNDLTLNRRTFLAASALAGGGFALGYRVALAAEESASSLEFNPFIRIAPNDTITLILHKPENGQGAVTSLCMLLAEELECDWERLTWEFAPVARVYGAPMQGTFGSSGIRSSWKPLREAGAKARLMLQSAAAERWNVDVAQTRTQNGRVLRNGSNDSFSYGELATAAAQLPVPETVTLKTPQQYRLIGKTTPRRDTLAKLTGQARYGIDMRVPDMAFAVLERCPVFGGTVQSFDAARTRAFPGVLDVVQVSRGVAVLASNTWAALEGRKLLDITWDFGPLATLSSARIREMQQALLKTPGAVARSDGDVDAAFAQAAKRVSATYEVPYLAHTTLEPPNATARIDASGAELWSGSQIPGLCQQGAMQVTGLPEERVKVHTLFIGGGFGSRGGGNVYSEAAEIAQVAGRAVNLLYSREDDVQQDRYRPCSLVQLDAALDAQGWPVALRGHVSCQHFQPLRNGIDREAVAGLADNDYAIAAQHFEYSPLELEVPTNFWRSVGASQNVYFMEAFLDEIAAAGNKDPLELRLRLLERAPRLRHALQVAAERAGWNTPLAPGRQRGLACVSCFGSHNAQVVELSVENGRVRVHKVTCAIDCGQVVNPHTVTQQMQGGIVYGLSAALYSEITLENGRVQQSNFHDYDALRMDAMPEIDVIIIPSDDPTPGGVGETATPAIAPAVVNAVAAAIGQRVRRLPVAKNLPAQA